MSNEDQPLYGAPMKVLPICAIAGLVAAGVAAVAFADDASDASDRARYLQDIDSKLSSAASSVSGLKSDSNDGDLSYADRYVEEVRDLVGRLSYVKGDDSKAREVVDRYPGYIDRYKRASEALHGMKGYQHGNVTLMKTCQDKNAELVGQAREFENKNDPEGLEKLPRLAAEAKNLTVRFLEEAEKFRYQMEGWKGTVKYFDVSDGKWSDVRSALGREADEIYDYYKSDQDAAKERCRDLAAGPDHPVVREVLGKLANSSAGRKEVMDNLMRLVGEMAGKIRDVPGASGGYAVDGVREKLDAIDSALQILDRTRGADPKAKAIVDTWPSIAREARAAIEPLRELKEHHHALDELPGKCKDLESRLDAFVSSNGDDVDGIEKLPTFATELGAPVIVGMAKAKERLDKMSYARDNTQRFSRSDTGWSDVSSAYRSSSSTIYEFFKSRYDETEGACRDIVKQDRHPKVVAAVERLKGLNGSAGERLARRAGELRGRWATLQATYVQFEKDFWQLQNDSKQWRAFDGEELSKLVVAICGEDHERDGDEADRLSSELSAKVVAAARPHRDDYVRRSDDLGARLPTLYRDLAALNGDVDAAVTEFENVKKIDRSVVSGLRDLGAEVKKVREEKRSTFFALQESDRQSFLNVVEAVLLGQNHPRVAASSKYGRAKHRELQGSSTFQCAEKEFAAGGGFADCVSHAQCTVWEFKPDSWNQRDALDQAAKYVGDVKKAFPRDGSDGKAWEHCWKSSGPTGGEGFEARAYLYPKCDARQ